MNEQEARAHVKEIRGFYLHLSRWFGVSLFLCVSNLITDPDHLWFLYPTLGWGIGILAHGVKTYSGNKKWEDRKVEELMASRQTRDELNRLSERTDTLITILSGIDWEQIDPELVNVKQNLVDAKDKIKSLERGENSSDKEQVTKEIEKLEEFVTSSKFDFYELAAK
ncbi:2TM domain-containing protein [Alteromonas sp. 5E99-2]|uniref:2TM domain-containing protein n=1 Tax=Alteromonas sp. 5E99-2 TaxID=2817683 RepID=UPI001A98C1C0|nr:2TM domain-containing protein [Alteromonas sp. 5E99-2]MBO1255293.1 2TM domain-containing protein [Alteromonas sp. 5E99-2]